MGGDITLVFYKSKHDMVNGLLQSLHVVLAMFREEILILSDLLPDVIGSFDG